MMTRARGLAAAAAIMAICVLAEDARADRRVVRVTIVADDSIAGDMREVLAGTPDVTVVTRRRAQLELRGTVAEVTRRTVHDGVEIRARVMVVVSDARGGAVRAMVTGRAGARGGADPAQLRRNALRAAVRGALRSLSANRHALRV